MYPLVVQTSEKVGVSVSWFDAGILMTVSPLEVSDSWTGAMLTVTLQVIQPREFRICNATNDPHLRGVSRS